jgi:hypothetical protein
MIRKLHCFTTRTGYRVDASTRKIRVKIRQFDTKRNGQLQKSKPENKMAKRCGVSPNFLNQPF